MGAFLDTHRRLLPAFLSEMTGGRFAVSVMVVTLIALRGSTRGVPRCQPRCPSHPPASTSLRRDRISSQFPAQRCRNRSVGPWQMCWSRCDSAAACR